MAPLIHYLNRLAADRWARQGVRTIMRALWLSLCLWCIALGSSLVWGWTFRYELLGSATLAIIGISVLFLLRRRMTALEVARRLDRRFHLDEQLATAVEIAATRRVDSGIAARLLHDSGQTAAHLHRRLVRRRVIGWSDVGLLVALFVVLAGLAVLVAIGRPNNDLAGASLQPPPSLIQPQDEQLQQEPFQQPGQQPGQGATGTQASNTPGVDPQTTGPLADALREQGATRPAADALDRGDIQGAAQQLRELADQADQLSEQSRKDLANRLRQQARKVEGRNQQLADQMRQSANGLEEGGNDAQQAMSDLAQAVENLQQPQQQSADVGQQDKQQSQQGQGQQGNQAGQQAQQGQGQQGNQAGQQAQQGQGQQGNQAGQQAQQGNQSGQSEGQNSSASGAGNSAATGQRQSAPSSRLGVEGQPLELKADGTGQNAERTSQQPESSISVPGRTAGGGNSSANGVTGADPLRIPVDERDVVQGYFTP